MPPTVIPGFLRCGAGATRRGGILVLVLCAALSACAAPGPGPYTQAPPAPKPIAQNSPAAGLVFTALVFLLF